MSSLQGFAVTVLVSSLAVSAWPATFLLGLPGLALNGCLKQKPAMRHTAASPDPGPPPAPALPC